MTTPTTRASPRTSPGKARAKAQPRSRARTRAGSNGKATRPAATRPVPEWELRLYIAGTTVKAAAALANLQRICEERLVGKYCIEVIDLLRNPELARGDQILAIPTLVRKLPKPVKKIIGDLSSAERVLVGLDLRSL